MKVFDIHAWFDCQRGEADFLFYLNFEKSVLGGVGRGGWQMKCQGLTRQGVIGLGFKADHDEWFVDEDDYVFVTMDEYIRLSERLLGNEPTFQA
jgi:hypothetical protein